MQQDIRDVSIHHSHEQKYSFRNEVLVADPTAKLKVTKFRLFHSKEKTTKFGKTELYKIPMEHAIGIPIPITPAEWDPEPLDKWISSVVLQLWMWKRTFFFQ
jgi:hypothetical protein